MAERQNLSIFFYIVVALCLSGNSDATTLRATVTGNISALLIPFEALVTGVTNPHAMLYDSLTYVGNGGVIEPGLAVSWERTAPTTWLIHLRPGVVFSNGEPLTAEGVAQTFRYLKGPEARRFVISAEVRTIERIEVIDDLTLEIITHKPDAIFAKRLSTILIPAPRAYQELGPEAFSLAPSGTGSFMLEDWGLYTGRTVLVANPTSWRRSQQVNRVELLVINEHTTQFQALLTGRIDMAYNFGILELDDLESIGFKVHVIPSGQVLSLALPNNRPNSPLNDVRVRQALNYAVDNSALAELVFGGHMRPAGQGAIPTVFGYNPDISPYPYNPDMARALLKDAGFSDGLRLVAGVLIPSIPEDVTMYLKIQQDMATAGVDLQIKPMRGPEWIRRYFSGDWQEYDTISATWNSAAYWDAGRAIEIFSCKKQGAFFCLPEMLDMIDASNSNFDPISRKRQLQVMLAELHRQAASVFLVELADVVVTSSRMLNFPTRHKQLRVEELRLADDS